MKRAFSALTAALSVMLSCASGCLPASAAYEPKSATAIKATAIIDGEAEEIWQKAEVLEANLINRTIIYNPDTESTATASVRLLWDEKYLYVFAEVLDADPNPENRLGSPDFIPDGIEIQIDEQNDKSGKNNVPAGNACAGSWQVFADGSESGFGDQFTAGRAKFRSAVKPTPSGYNVEMAIPWNRLTPEVGTKIGLEIQIHDNITGKTREGLVTWNSDACLGWQDTEAMGTVTFLDSPEGYIPPETSGTVTTEPPTSEPETSSPETGKPGTSGKQESAEKPAGSIPSTGTDVTSDNEKGVSPAVIAVCAAIAAAVIAVIAVMAAKKKKAAGK